MKATTVRNAHCVQLCRSLWALQQSGQLCDLSLRVGDDVISAHRTVLAASATFFLQRKSTHSEEKERSAIINISETSTALVQEIVRFVYTGVLTVNTENVDGIYNLCKKWHINSAKVLCEKFKIVQEKQKSTDGDTNRRLLRKRPLCISAIERIASKLQCDNSVDDENNATNDEAPCIKRDVKEEADDTMGSIWEHCEETAQKQLVTNQTIVQVVRKRGRPPGINKKPGRGRPSKIKRDEVKDNEEIEKGAVDAIPAKWQLAKTCHNSYDELAESPENLVAHKLSCEKLNTVRPYAVRKCRKCKRVFDSVKDCKLHREACNASVLEDTHRHGHTAKRVYRKCHRCHEVFNTPEQLLEHKKECRTAKISKPYAIRKCRKCKIKFETTEDCAKHQLECTAAAEKPPPEHFKYKCDKCCKAFTKKRTLDSHVLTKHWSVDTPGPEYFFCKIEGCAFKTLYPYYMQKHIHWTHAKDKAIMCDICGAMSKNEYYLKAHKRIRHSEAEIFACDVCGMKIRTQQSLKMHRIRVHGAEQPTKLCSHCTYITYTKSELDRHMFQNHGPQFLHSF